VVRHVDAIGKADESLIAITMTGRIASAPSTSGLKVQLCAARHHVPPTDSNAYMWRHAPIGAALRQQVCHNCATGPSDFTAS